MKRNWKALTVLVMAVVVASVCFGVLPQWGVAAVVPESTTVTLLVNDTSAIGTVGGNKLSLDEAIQLANGSLKLSRLSAAQRAQITGTPGSGTADLIRVALKPGTVIDASAALSVLRGNTGDTINGNGATLAGDGNGTALTLSSSHLTLNNLTIKGFHAELVVDPAGQSLHDIIVTKVHLDPAPDGTLMVGSSKSNGSLDGLVVTNSVFDGGTASQSEFLNRATKGVFDTGATAQQSDAALLTVGIGAGFANSSSTVSNASLDNVIFAHNQVTNGFEGLYVFGGLAQRSEVRHSLTQNVQILDNQFPNVPDASLNAIGSEGIGSGSDNGVENLTISGNDVTARDWGIALWGGETYGDGFSQDNYVRDVDITHNTVVGASGPFIAGASDCIDLEGAWTTIGQGVQAGSSISGVHVNNNQVSGNCTVGIKATGGVAEVPPSSATSGNSINNVSIQGNDVRDAATGLEIEGGYTLGPVGTFVVGNAVREVNVVQNSFVGNGSGTGIEMIGGVSQASAVVTSNSVGSITFVGNVEHGYSTACTTLVNMGSQAYGNYNSVACPQP
jgi:hypothetical protein